MVLLEVDPNLVQPGWTALLVIVLLGIVLALLGRSMKRQIGRIRVPADGDRAEGDGPPADGDTDDDGAEPAGGESGRATPAERP